MTEVSFTVGKLDASIALLLTSDHHLIEFPTILLPDGIKPGSYVTIKANQDTAKESSEKEKFDQLQDSILNLYGTHEPQAPVLKVKNITQTSVVLEWDPIELGSAQVKSLTLYKDDVKLGRIPNPLSNKTTKLSGLPVNKDFEFKLRLDTTAGVLYSNSMKITTHKMTDLSGITVCIGDIQAHEGIEIEDIVSTLQEIGAKPLQTEVAVDTTHFIATAGNGLQWKKALESNIPVVRPEWLRACALERRIIGVKDFYLDCDPGKLKELRFPKKNEQQSASTATEQSQEENESQQQIPQIELTSHEDEQQTLQPETTEPTPTHEPINVITENTPISKESKSESKQPVPISKEAEEEEEEEVDLQNDNDEVTQEVSTEDITIPTSTDTDSTTIVGAAAVDKSEEVERSIDAPEVTVLTEQQPAEEKEEAVATLEDTPVVEQEVVKPQVEESQEFEDVELSKSDDEAKPVDEAKEEEVAVAAEHEADVGDYVEHEPMVEEPVKIQAESELESTAVEETEAKQTTIDKEEEEDHDDQEDDADEEEEKPEETKTPANSSSGPVSGKKKKNKTKKKGGKK